MAMLGSAWCVLYYLQYSYLKRLLHVTEPCAYDSSVWAADRFSRSHSTSTPYGLTFTGCAFHCCNHIYVGFLWPRVNIFAMLVQFLTEARDFCLLCSIQTGPGAHWVSCTMGTGALPPGVELYLYSHIHLHGMVLNEWSTGITVLCLYHYLLVKIWRPAQ
jgi:hypothetical protein